MSANGKNSRIVETIELDNRFSFQAKFSVNSKILLHSLNIYKFADDVKMKISADSKKPIYFIFSENDRLIVCPLSDIVD